MPLIKHVNVAPELMGYDYRNRNDLMRADLIRHVVNGGHQSLRTLGLNGRSAPSLIITNTLKELAEPDVVVGQEAVDVYVNAQETLCHETSRLFAKAKGVGVFPSREKGGVIVVGAKRAGDQAAIEINADWVWFPMTMMMMGVEAVVLLRVLPRSELAYGLQLSNSFALGMAVKDLDHLFPELAEYVNYLKNKASEDPDVAYVFRRLMQLLQPREAAAIEARERAERYQDVQHFGAWG